MGYNKISFFIDGLGFTFTICFFRPTKNIKKYLIFFFLIDINFFHIYQEKKIFYPISLKKNYLF